MRRALFVLVGCLIVLGLYLSGCAGVVSLPTNTVTPSHTTRSKGSPSRLTVSYLYSSVSTLGCPGSSQPRFARAIGPSRPRLPHLEELHGRGSSIASCPPFGHQGACRMGRSCWYRGVWWGLLFVLSQAWPAAAQVRLCNATAVTVKTAIATLLDQGNLGYRITWGTLQAGNCGVFTPPPAEGHQRVFVYAQDDRRNEWYGRSKARWRQFCVPLRNQDGNTVFGSAWNDSCPAGAELRHFQAVNVVDELAFMEDNRSAYELPGGRRVAGISVEEIAAAPMNAPPAAVASPGAAPTVSQPPVTPPRASPSP